MKYNFQVGDRVRIKYEYWERLSKNRSAIKLYVNNGPDYVYTVCAIDDDGSICISNYGDSWCNPGRYLEFANAEEDEGLPCQILEEIL